MHTSHPPVLSPKIDKISVTVPVFDPYRQKTIRAYLMDAANSDDGIFLPNKKKGGYKTAVRLHPPVADKTFVDFILIQAAPYSPKAPFLRFEWNPHKLGSQGWYSARQMLCTVLPHGYDDVLKDGRVTRIDIALDLIGHHAGELIVRGKQMKTFHPFFGASGEVESYYLGKSKADQIVIYHRTANGKSDGQPLTRIEFRVKSGIGLASLADMKNPFRRLEVIDASVFENALSPAVAAWFKDSCRLRGLKNALKLANLDSMASKLPPLGSNKLSSSWWNADELWDTWPDVLDRYRLLYSEAEEYEFGQHPFAINCKEGTPSLAA